MCICLCLPCCHSRWIPSLSLISPRIREESHLPFCSSPDKLLFSHQHFICNLSKFRAVFTRSTLAPSSYRCVKLLRWKWNKMIIPALSNDYFEMLWWCFSLQHAQDIRHSKVLSLTVSFAFKMHKHHKNVFGQNINVFLAVNFLCFTMYLQTLEDSSSFASYKWLLFNTLSTHLLDKHEDWIHSCKHSIIFIYILQHDMKIHL